jgi:hypothetical protein
MIPPAAAASSFLSALPGFMATKTTSTLARDKLPYHAPSCGPLSGRSETTEVTKRTPPVRRESATCTEIKQWFREFQRWPPRASGGRPGRDRRRPGTTGRLTPGDTRSISCYCAHKTQRNGSVYLRVRLYRDRQPRAPCHDLPASLVCPLPSYLPARRRCHPRRLRGSAAAVASIRAKVQLLPLAPHAREAVGQAGTKHRA